MRLPRLRYVLLASLLLTSWSRPTLAQGRELVLGVAPGAAVVDDFSTMGGTAFLGINLPAAPWLTIEPSLRIHLFTFLDPKLVGASLGLRAWFNLIGDETVRLLVGPSLAASAWLFSGAHVAVSVFQPGAFVAARFALPPRLSVVLGAGLEWFTFSGTTLLLPGITASLNVSLE